MNKPIALINTMYFSMLMRLARILIGDALSFLLELDVIARLLKLLLPHKAVALSGLAFVLIFTNLGLIIPWGLKHIIDELLPAKNTRHLLAFLGLLALVIGVRQIFFYAGKRMVFTACMKVLLDIRCKLFTHVQRLSLNFHSKYRTGRLISNIITDVSKLQSMIMQTANILVANTVAIVFTMVFLFAMNWQLALVCIAVLPLFGWNFHRFQAELFVRNKQLSMKISEISANLSEVLSGVRIVKSFGMEPAENRRFAGEFEDVYGMQERINKNNILCGMFSDILGNIGNLSILGIGSWMVWNEGMSIGEFVCFYTYSCMLYSPIAQIAALAPVLGEGMASLHRVFSIMDEIPEIVPGNKSLPDNIGQGAISFTGVDFCYGHDEKVLDDFNLEVKPGETVALVGPSGSGKSTIASLLLRFYDVDKGSVKLDGVDIRELKSQSFRSAVGVVLQEPFLFSGTVAENIAYGRPGAKWEDIVAAAKLANAHDFIEQLHDGYQTEVGERGMSLSGGQKQRIAIARTILKRPRILILDEATSALDNSSEREVQIALNRVMKNCTTIVIAHRLSTIRHADKIVVMDGGHIMEQGNHEELLANQGLYAHLLSLGMKLEKPEESHLALAAV